MWTPPHPHNYFQESLSAVLLGSETCPVKALVISFLSCSGLSQQYPLLGLQCLSTGRKGSHCCLWWSRWASSLHVLAGLAAWSCWVHQHQYYPRCQMSSRHQHHRSGIILLVWKWLWSWKCKSLIELHKNVETLFSFPLVLPSSTWFYNNAAVAWWLTDFYLVSHRPYTLFLQQHASTHTTHVQTNHHENSQRSEWDTHPREKHLTRISLWQWMNFWVKGRQQETGRDKTEINDYYDLHSVHPRILVQVLDMFSSTGPNTLVINTYLLNESTG